MKSKYLIFILILNLYLSVSSCKKEVVFIDPTTQPSELSRVLKIESGKILNGILPSSNANIRVTNSSTTASITNDNSLYIPFVTASTAKVKGVFLQIEGADNYWNIPLTYTSSNIYILDVKVPNNILDGTFKIKYSLYDDAGNVGSPTTMKTDIVSPTDFCKDGKSFGRVNGRDGITVRTYTLGEQAGWVTISYNMFTVKDRMDIKYDGQWIRSTAQQLLKEGDKPIIKPCWQTTTGDGFVSGVGSFSFYYNPKISKRLDVYASGCLEGGTEWWFEVQDCPKEMVTLGIHSNVSPNNDLLSGHAWITVTQNGETQFYGLWPEDMAKIQAYPRIPNSSSDVRKGAEKGYGSFKRYYPLTTAQIQRLNAFLAKPYKWNPLYNCSSYAEDFIDYVVGEKVEASEGVPGNIVETPRQITKSILELERNSTTTAYSPPNLNEDKSSCSFCK